MASQPFHPHAGKMPMSSNQPPFQPQTTLQFPKFGPSTNSQADTKFGQPFNKGSGVGADPSEKNQSSVLPATPSPIPRDIPSAKPAMQPGASQNFLVPPAQGSLSLSPSAKSSPSQNFASPIFYTPQKSGFSAIEKPGPSAAAQGAPSGFPKPSLQQTAVAGANITFPQSTKPVFKPGSQFLFKPSVKSGPPSSQPTNAAVLAAPVPQLQHMDSSAAAPVPAKGASGKEEAKTVGPMLPKFSFIVAPKSGVVPPSMSKVEIGKPGPYDQQRQPWTPYPPGTKRASPSVYSSLSVPSETPGGTKSSVPAKPMPPPFATSRTVPLDETKVSFPLKSGPPPFAGKLSGTPCSNCRLLRQLSEDVKCPKRCQVCKVCLRSQLSEGKTKCPSCMRELNQKELKAISAYTSEQ